MTLAKKVLSVTEDESREIVSAKEIQKAIAPACKAIVKKGYHKPEFHVNYKDGKSHILADNHDSDYGTTWVGDYANFDDKGLESWVRRGDKVTLQFLQDDEYGGSEIKGEVVIDTRTMKVTTEMF